jgi:asparagine synthase (glutamine-hydrolysing)
MAFAGLLSKGSIFSEEKYIRAVVEQSGCEFHPFELEGLSPTAGVLHQIDAVGSPFLSGNLFIPEHAYMLASKFGARVYMEGYDGDNAIGHGVELFRDLARKGHWWRLYRELKAFHAKGGVFGHQTLNWTPSSTVRNYLWHTRIKNWSATRLAMRATGKAGRLLGLRGGKPPVVRDHFPPFLPKIRSEIWQRRKAALGDLKPHENTRHAHIAIISSGKHPWLIEMTTALAQSYGVELRLPFYDTRLIEFCAAIPEDQKLRDGLVRWVMRNAMEGYLPDLVRLRPEKSNYEINFAEVFRREELGRLKRLLVDQDLGLGEILDMDSVRGLVSRLEEGKLMGEGLASLHHIFTVALWLEHGWSGSLPMSTRTASSIIPPA